MPEILQNNNNVKEWMKNGIESKKSENSLNSCNGVKFSLNKRKNWLLPEKLKNEVIGESQRDKEPSESLSKKKEKCFGKSLSKVAVIDKTMEWGGGKSLAEHETSFISSVDECNNRHSKSWYVFH